MAYFWPSKESAVSFLVLREKTTFRKENPRSQASSQCLPFLPTEAGGGGESRYPKLNHHRQQRKFEIGRKTSEDQNPTQFGQLA